MKILFCIASFLIPANLWADVWVNPRIGSDQNKGTQQSPLASVEAGLSIVEPGITLHVVSDGQPIHGDIRVTKSGTQQQPIVIDGHGTIVTNRVQLPVSAWKDEGAGIYSRKLPNNAWGMYRHWEGGFPLAWFDNKSGTNVTSQDQLRPRSYFLYKNRHESKTDPLHNTLYICIEPDQKLSDIHVESIAGESGIFVGGDYVIVRNFIAEYGGRDGFATHRNKGIVFENVEARYFMDQGMSHHGAEVVVRNSRFHHNAGAGIVDVYPEVKVQYENCLIEANTWRGGIEMHAGVFDFVGCTIRGNNGPAIVVTKGATARMEACKIAGDSRFSGPIIQVSRDSQLSLKGCSIVPAPLQQTQAIADD